MKNLKKVAILTLAATVIATSFALPQTAKAETTDITANMPSADDLPVYRLYNPDNGEHLYTTDANECSELYSHQGWGYEGIAWMSSTEGTPVYRLYNSVLCNHLYTTDTNEIKVLTSMDDTAWTVDNNNEPLFYSAGNTPVYRVYNEDLNGMHHLTTDANEYDTLPDYGWAQEGVSFYATGAATPRTRTVYRAKDYSGYGDSMANICPYPIYTWINFGDGVIGYYIPSNDQVNFDIEKNMYEYARINGYAGIGSSPSGYFEGGYDINSEGNEILKAKHLKEMQTYEDTYIAELVLFIPKEW